MIPVGGFIVGVQPVSQIPNYPLPKLVTLAYRVGATDFSPRDRVPPFTAVVLSTGLFDGGILSGENGSQFGFRAELRRQGVYGTILIDRLVFDVAAIQLTIEGCPNTTDESAETSAPVTLTSEEACPHVTVPIEETSVNISALVISDDSC